MTSDAQLTVFFDGNCPLCSREMQHLRKLDTSSRIALFDLASPDAEALLAAHHPDINVVEADRILHGKTHDGRVIKGLDVTHMAWSLVGKGHLTAPLRWRFTAPIADRFYLLFAGQRHRISALLTGNFKAAFSPNSCSDGCRISARDQDAQDKRGNDLHARNR